MLRPASLEWITVVQDLFLEGASPARIAAWLDGKVEAHDSYIVVRRMGAIDGFDATILVRNGRATALSVWYRELEKPTLADAQALLGTASERSGMMFELVFDEATRPIDATSQLVISCSAKGYSSDASAERSLVGIALTVAIASARKRQRGRPASR